MGLKITLRLISNKKDNYSMHVNQVRAILCFVCVVILSLTVPVRAADGVKSEEELIGMLASTNSAAVNQALVLLPRLYPHSTNSFTVLTGLVRSGEFTGRALKAFEQYRTILTDRELKEICLLLHSPATTDVRHGLKALRAIQAPSTVPEVLLVLSANNDLLVVDACRTLAAIGDASVIPEIEKLMHRPEELQTRDCMFLRIFSVSSWIQGGNRDRKVRQAAREAMATLRAKAAAKG